MITYRHQERFNFIVAKSRDYFRSPAGTHYNTSLHDISLRHNRFTGYHFGRQNLAECNSNSQVFKFARKCLLKFQSEFQEAFTIQSDSVILNISAISGFFEVAEGGILFYRHSVADRSTVSVYHDYVDSLTESISIDG